MLDIRELMNLKEAYAEVYAPQELTEEQVWEEVEYWVNDLIEEGYDLSDYTWEEMYESYLEEILGMPGAQNAGAALRQGFGQARRSVGGTIGGVAKGAADVAGSAARGAVGKTTTSKNPISQAYNAVARGVTAAPRSAASFAGGVLSGKPATTQAAKPAPSSAPYKSRFAGARDAAVAKAQNIKGSPVVGSGKVGSGAAAPAASVKPATSTPAARPAASAPKPAAATTPAAKPAGSAMDQFAKANPKLAASAAERDRTRGTSATTNPLMKDMKSRLPAPKTPSPSTAKTGFDLAKKGVNLAASFDMFDVVKGYLIGEGYADTEEAALAIMTNMSEEWRQSIIVESGKNDARIRGNIKSFGSNYTPPRDWDQSANRGQGAVLNAKQKEKQRRKGLRQEEYMDEAITSEKGKAKAAEMIAARSTPSGRAKSGKGANVAQIRQIRGSGRGSFDREGLGGTPMTPTMAKNPIKKQNYIGTGNKAARRAGTYKESFNIFVNSMIAEGVSMERYTWEEIQNVFDDLFEAQVANRDPDEYERKEKQGQSREQQLKGRVMGRMSQMDPDKKAAMLKQMRAVGLDV